jgi:hypothetical protein
MEVADSSSPGSGQTVRIDRFRISEKDSRNRAAHSITYRTRFDLKHVTCASQENIPDSIVHLRKEPDSCDEDITSMTITLPSPFSTVSCELRLRVGAHKHPGAHTLRAECVRLANAPFELFTRESPEDQVAKERRRQLANY